ncbi:hypothetical protein [Phocaeicola sp.]|uniref:hypothetical protein n=1 Tax=Phocaeicola sp. TaxID=2773926 RepID=UPI003AB90EE8
MAAVEGTSEKECELVGYFVVHLRRKRYGTDRRGNIQGGFGDFATPHVWLAGLLVSLIGIEHVGLSFFTLYQGISCQYALTLEPQEMVLQQDEDELVKFAYSDLRKVNFTSVPFVSREFIPFIELLDADFAYHCYPIERVPVKKFDEIVSLLRQLEIDATNSFE